MALHLKTFVIRFCIGDFDSNIFKSLLSLHIKQDLAIGVYGSLKAFTNVQACKTWLQQMINRPLDYLRIFMCDCPIDLISDRNTCIKSKEVDIYQSDQENIHAPFLIDNPYIQHLTDKGGILTETSLPYFEKNGSITSFN